MRIIMACCFFAAGMSLNAQAQNEVDTTVAAPAKSGFKAAISYQNNAVYLGRKDSARVPYITPNITYTHKTGLYFGASFSYLAAAAEKRIDVYNLSAGYDHNFSDKFGMTVYVDKSFYNDSSNNVTNDIGASVSTGVHYDFGVVNVGLSGGISFASKNDYNGSVYVSKYITLDRKEQWSIEPSLTANFNTLHFYEGYNNKSFNKGQRKRNPLIASISSETMVNNNAFTLMDVELALPINYETKKWGIFVTPIFAMPHNPIYTTTVTTIKLRNGTSTTRTVDSTPDSEKNLQNSVYVEIGAYFKF